MSRCFPYPPPGYLRLGLVDETIKLKREKVLPKTEQKLHKRERERERKNEKKGKDKTRCLNKKLKKLDDVVNGLDDQSEKSDLTDEHGPPVCYTSDVTQNCNKRKRENVSSRECKADGNKIKIRFSLKKPWISDSSVCEEPLVCSSSLRAESVQEQSYTIAHVPEQKPRHNELSVCEQNLRHDELPVPKQNPHHDDGRKDQGSSSSRTSAKDKKMPKAALQYTTLIEDWMPPLLQLDHNDDDDNNDCWLFSTKPLVKPVAKRIDDNDVTCARAASFPRAHFLPEAEIYALPYTVPF